jgi:hypothetical protein
MRAISPAASFSTPAPHEWADKPKIFMDRAVLQKVSDRWNECGFWQSSGGKHD